MSFTERTRSIISRLQAAVSLFVERPSAVGAALTWRPFSMTSFRMVDDLRRQGVLPRTVIDGGANVGQFARAALKLLHPTRIHAFEPLPAAVITLRRTFNEAPEVIVHGVALGASSGQLLLRVNMHSHSSSVLPLGTAHLDAFPHAREVGQVAVPVRTLDDELRGADLREPVLIELDVQGYERWVLDGAQSTLAHTDWVILELSFRPMYEGESLFLDMVADMKKRGFDLVRHVGWLADPNSGEILQTDALFARAGS